MTTSSWQERAKCSPADTPLFFPAHPSRGAYKKARAICTGCPVVQECRDFVMEFEPSDIRHGFYGGLSPAERDELAAGPHTPVCQKDGCEKYVRAAGLCRTHYMAVYRSRLKGRTAA